MEVPCSARTPFAVRADSILRFDSIRMSRWNEVLATMAKTKLSIVASLPWARPVPDELVKSLSIGFQSDWHSLAVELDADSISAATTLLLAIAHMAVHLLLDGPHILLTNMWPSGTSHFREKPERGHALCPSYQSQPSITSSAPPDRISFVVGTHRRYTEPPIVCATAPRPTGAVDATLSAAHASFILHHASLVPVPLPPRFKLRPLHDLVSRLFEAGHRQMHPFSQYRYSIDTSFTKTIQTALELVCFVIVDESKDNDNDEEDDDEEEDDDDEDDVATADAPSRERPPSHMGKFFRHISFPAGGEDEQMVSQLSSSSDSSDCDDDSTYCPSPTPEQNEPPTLMSLVTSLIA